MIIVEKKGKINPPFSFMIIVEKKGKINPPFSFMIIFEKKGKINLPYSPAPQGGFSFMRIFWRRGKGWGNKECSKSPSKAFVKKSVFMLYTTIHE
jgi:hypothetical protein